MTFNLGDPRLPARFWAKVRIAEIPAYCPELGPCWRWTASCDAGGYGKFRVGSLSDGSRRIVPAHRLAYETVAGPIPQGLQSDHLCRNRACVNPAHIEPVTNSENARRSPLMNGRSNKGEANGRARLREADIPLIRALRGRLTQHDLASWYRVGKTTIRHIHRGQSWRHI